MKIITKQALPLTYIALLISFTQSCQDVKKEADKDIVHTEKSVKLPEKELSGDFKNYWYAGDAEITSYELQLARYGEIREGKAVLVFVTEPFLKDKQVKADGNNPDNIPVLKLNVTKKYLTGIYPYSIMTSTFYPVHDNQHALKVSFSAQEWCGQVYAQLNNREKFNVISHSYFEGEADQDFKLEKTVLENELWNKIRVSPETLPVGDLKTIPSLEFIRLSHKELKPYESTASLSAGDSVSTYQITYPELERTLKINFTTAFPHSIESWSDSFTSGFGEKAKQMTSTATKIKTLKTPYWQQNGNKHLSLRDSLGL
ncbi:septum formation inhibitor Maf [Zobellia uliginosa]|uniref:septum formation inhibitor Maf n=1 Tax=Zobellia uliginosa TaxID=143224 RepID=UPI001C067FC3|nr:septum formation inhibitor Maf [Zobellia uliginosa]MBU2946817.1 septum formation inhibitor Maf [Zobellia uliginosa]